MSPRQFVVVQLFLELLIPALGYFFWKWDAAFILFFYAFDWLAVLVFNGLKTYKRLQFTSLWNERKQAIIHHGISFLSFLGAILAMNFTLQHVFQNFDIMKRFMDFLSYEDMGIAQGYILVPLVFMNGFSVYKRSFLVPKLFERRSVKELQQYSSIQSLLVLAVCLIFLAISFVTSLNQELILFSCIFGVFGGKLYFQISKA